MYNSRSMPDKTVFNTFQVPVQNPDRTGADGANPQSATGAERTVNPEQETKVLNTEKESRGRHMKGLYPFFLKDELWQYLYIDVADHRTYFFFTTTQGSKVYHLDIMPDVKPEADTAKFQRYDKVLGDGLVETQFHCFDPEVFSDQQGRLYRKKQKRDSKI
jgi:hypothetical protein